MMRGNRSYDTSAEVAVRSLLHRRGYRFRKRALIAAGGLRVRPDIVFSRQRLAVFIDGCFWHCCPEHGHSPRSNVAYWGPKLSRNRRRDELVNEALKATGWRVLRFWEHVAPEDVVRDIVAALGAPLAETHSGP